MSEFPSLGKFLRDHKDVTNDGYRNPYMKGHPACECGWEQNDASGIGPFWDDHIADAWREACTITTVEQLDALPVGSVVMALWDGGPLHHSFSRYSDSWLTTGTNHPAYPLGARTSNPNSNETVLLLRHPEWSN